MRFSGKVAFITGGGGGLGAAFGHTLTEEGTCVALVDIDAPAAARVADELRADGHDALALGCDITDEHQVEAVVAGVIEHFGRIDILVNNAALHRRKYNQPFSELPRSDVRALFEVNVMGVVNCSVACRAALAAAGNGVIVNIASTSSNQSRTPYGVSKLAVRGLTTALAHEFGADGIRVNAISPGFVGSAGALASVAREDLLAILSALGAMVPPQVLDKCSTDDLIAIVTNLQSVAREGTPADVVEALLYLCSERSGYVTGETLRIAGGSSISF